MNPENGDFKKDKKNCLTNFATTKAIDSYNGERKVDNPSNKNLF